MNDRFSRTSTLAILTLVIFIAARGTSLAEVNRTPIAIPLIGTQGVASPYPSTISVVPPATPGEPGQVSIVLHAVTHPCPKDLSVVLVHEGEQFLLMNNVGGCRPLQGTTIEFVNDNTVPMLSTSPQTEGTPFPDFVRASASFEGPQPTMPAPFPQGGAMVSGMPTEIVRADGQWDLYVIDKGAEHRGVIAGGWSVQYETRLLALTGQTVVLVPGTGTEGRASVYPIPFDLSTLSEDLRVTRLSAALELTHTNPDDVVMVLVSPGGIAVPLMANCGGVIDISGVALEFTDTTSATVPDATQIVAGQYRPSDRKGIAAIPEGPQAPTLTFSTTMAAFKGEQVRGIWTLWVYDDLNGFVGQVVAPRLNITAAPEPKPSIATPAATSTSTQPFVRVDGLLAGFESARGTVTWRVATEGAYYDAGAFAFDPQSGRIGADIPVKQGLNRIQYRAWSHGSPSITGELQVSVAEFTYSLAEGATGSFFDLDVTLGNPGAANAPVRIDLLPEDAPPSSHPDVVSAGAPLQLAVDTLGPEGAVSTVVHSTNAVPLAVERTMRWDSRGYGGHGGGATSPATRWLFAEGAQGFFNTFVLLANDNASAVNVTVKFLLEGGGVVTHPVTVPPRTRRTVFAGDLPAVVNHSFGLDITAGAPIIAERAMYFSQGTDRTFDGGHESAGVNETSTRWFLAEGATGPFFDCFVLLSNPNATAANVTLTYLLPDGTTIPQTLTIQPNSRHTINVEDVDPRLANAAVSTLVAALPGIVVERAMYWPSFADGWHEAHNSFGVTATALRWAVADGRLGGSRGYDTYILLANPNPVPAEVQVRFLKAGLTTPVTRSYTLRPTSRLNVQASADAPELGDGVFSAEITVFNFQPIAVEKAMYWNADGVVWAAGTNVTATRLPPP